MRRKSRLSETSQVLPTPSFTTTTRFPLKSQTAAPEHLPLANCEQLSVRSSSPGGPNKTRMEVHEKITEKSSCPGCVPKRSRTKLSLQVSDNQSLQKKAERTKRSKYPNLVDSSITLGVIAAMQDWLQPHNLLMDYFNRTLISVVTQN